MTASAMPETSRYSTTRPASVDKFGRTAATCEAGNGDACSCRFEHDKREGILPRGQGEHIRRCEELRRLLQRSDESDSVPEAKPTGVHQEPSPGRSGSLTPRPEKVNFCVGEASDDHGRELDEELCSLPPIQRPDSGNDECVGRYSQALPGRLPGRPSSGDLILVDCDERMAQGDLFG